MGDSGNSDPFPPGHGAGRDKHTLQSQKLLRSTGAGRKQRLHHFWHFNIETVNKRHNTRSETINLKTRINFLIHPASHSNPSPRLPQSTTELNLVKAAGTTQTLWEPGAPARAATTLGIQERHLGTQPQSQYQDGLGKRALVGMWVAVTASALTRGAGDFIRNPNYLVPEPSKCKRQRALGPAEEWPSLRRGCHPRPRGQQERTGEAHGRQQVTED